MQKLREECGVFGVFCSDAQEVAQTTYYGLFALQHRGQESCGIVVNDAGIFTSYKDIGLVNDVFTERRLNELGKGNIPWRKPWICVGGASGISYVTRKPYSILNQILLGEPGEYLTFNQVKSLGGSVKKGAKSKMVCF